MQLPRWQGWGILKSLLSEPSSQGLRAALRELLTNAPGPEDPVHLESPLLPCSFTGGSSTISWGTLPRHLPRLWVFPEWSVISVKNNVPETACYCIICPQPSVTSWPGSVQPQGAPSCPRRCHTPHPPWGGGPARPLAALVFPSGEPLFQKPECSGVRQLLALLHSDCVDS